MRMGAPLTVQPSASTGKRSARDRRRRRAGSGSRIPPALVAGARVSSAVVRRRALRSLRLGSDSCTRGALAAANAPPSSGSIMRTPLDSATRLAALGRVNMDQACKPGQVIDSSLPRVKASPAMRTTSEGWCGDDKTDDRAQEAGQTRPSIRKI